MDAAASETTERTKGVAKVSEEKSITEILIEKYNNMKKSFLEAIEELKMRRNNDQLQEEKINSLIREMFELKRTKEERIAELKKTVETITQEKCHLEKELEENLKVYEGEKSTHTLSLSSSSKGVKALKDEILALQLAKHGLEKKIKEQDHQLQVERSSRENVGKLVADWQVATSNANKQFEQASSRLEFLSTLVSKMEENQGKLVEVNAHHKCVVKNYKTNTTQLSNQLSELRAENTALKDLTAKNNKNTEASNEDAYLKEKISELQNVHEDLSREVNEVRAQKVVLLSSLAESGDLVASLQSKQDNAIQLNGLFQLEIDQLKTEVVSLKNEGKRKQDTIEQIEEKLKVAETASKEVAEKLHTKVRLLEDTNVSLQKNMETLEKKYNSATTENSTQSQRIVLLEKLNEEFRKGSPTEKPKASPQVAVDSENQPGMMDDSRSAAVVGDERKQITSEDEKKIAVGLETTGEIADSKNSELDCDISAMEGAKPDKVELVEINPGPDSESASIDLMNLTASAADISKNRVTFAAHNTLHIIDAVKASQGKSEGGDKISES